MATTVIMPKLGLTMRNGVITKWLKKEGDPVKKGEPIAEIETDKITNVVECPADGYLLKIIAAEGEERNILEPIGIVGEKGEEVDIP